MNLRRIALGACFATLVAAAAAIPHLLEHPTHPNPQHQTNTTLTHPPLVVLAHLEVDDNPTDVPPYDRDEFAPTGRDEWDWADLDADGCDTRQEVLRAEAIGPVHVDHGGRCPNITVGDWRSVYDGELITNPGDLDVDHLVPLAEAWEHGAWLWLQETKEAFANDPSDPDSLVAVTAGSNRSKGDQAPHEWMPEDPASWCWYGEAWVAVKAEWGLTVTTPERQALAQLLTDCVVRA